MNTAVMMQEYRQQVEQALRGCFRQEAERASLYDAMRYSLLAGGKRIRPVLVLEACRVCGGRPEDAMGFACALEMVHTYSLIHDDLPCMDDDDLRRGKPTNHKVFGEATAVLAGDGLLTAAFEVMVRDSAALTPAQVAEGVLCLSRAAGPGGMVGGQALDLAAEGCDLKLPDLQEIHSLKTGALIRAAAELGAIAAGAGQEQRQALDRYADKIGLAFQVQDDILDVVGEDALLGKPVGSDRASEKSTFVRLKGLDSCRAMVRRLTEQAVEALEPFEEREFLTRLAWDLSGREM